MRGVKRIRTSRRRGRPCVVHYGAALVSSIDRPSALEEVLGQPYDKAAKIVRAIYDRRISGPAVLELDRYFGFGAMFVQAWETIRSEALTVACRFQEIPRFHEIVPEQASISANDGRDWRMYILKA
jgi:hypothetical protein